LAISARAADPPGAGRPAAARPVPTIEPTLPLVIDVRFENIGRGAGATSALLVVEVTGADEIRDLVLETAMPAGLRPAGPARLPRGPMRFARGQVRRFVLPVSGDGTGRHAVRLEAVFRDMLGRTLRLGQGATLDPAAPAAGRSHLGAYEMMAVPIEELPR
jgi:hypothetical protein